MRFLHVLNAIVSQKGERRLTCESCGSTFACGASLSGCWCAEVKLDADSRNALKLRYRDCLCRDCLERVAAESGDRKLSRVE